MSKLYSVDKKNIKSAIISILLSSVLVMGIYVIAIGDIYLLDLKVLLNTGVIALITGVTSLIKSMLTDSNGDFVGTVEIK